MKVLSLKCENCGAQLDIAPKASTCVCSYCGGEQLVERDAEEVSVSEQEEVRDDAGRSLFMKRMASEQAIARFENDISDICKERDENLRVWHETQGKKGCLMGFLLLVGIVVALILVDAASIPLWLSIPNTVLLVMLVAKYIIKPQKEAGATIEANAEAKMAPLKEQIARHRAIIDSCDFGKTGEISLLFSMVDLSDG
ncbi:hypothetical protein [Duganella sp. HH101]|uniref:hypothetical protein n=1 Tax=Duganella sp. HH101 TaxID=1781066 RepID=UPI000873F06A|nr:hypothetical protein [Duganella sp. HH101]